MAITPSFIISLTHFSPILCLPCSPLRRAQETVKRADELTSCLGPFPLLPVDKVEFDSLSR